MCFLALVTLWQSRRHQKRKLRAVAPHHHSSNSRSAVSVSNIEYCTVVVSPISFQEYGPAPGKQLALIASTIDVDGNDNIKALENNRRKSASIRSVPQNWGSVGSLC